VRLTWKPQHTFTIGAAALATEPLDLAEEESISHA
jgi:hypothetical protein